MPSKTLHFASPRHISSLYASREENLAHTERALGVKLATREDWLRIDGPAEGVATAEALFVTCPLWPAGRHTAALEQATGVPVLSVANTMIWAALHATGFANGASGRSRDDGLVLSGAYVAAAVRCAPPANKPTPEERDACLPFLARELAILPWVEVIVCLGGFGWEAVLRVLGASRAGAARPRFGHGAEARVGRYTLLGTYHPSQQNTFTGRLTMPMFEAVFARAAELVAHG